MIDSLKELIKRMGRVRAAGYYSMSCPLVRVRVSCTPTEKCAGGYWVSGPPIFTLTYGARLTSLPKEAIPYDLVQPEEAPRVIGRLRERFNKANGPALKKIRDAERACASGH